jgi:hypothetical protein
VRAKDLRQKLEDDTLPAPTSHHGAAGRVSARGIVIEFLHDLNRLRSADGASPRQ